MKLRHPSPPRHIRVDRNSSLSARSIGTLTVFALLLVIFLSGSSLFGGYVDVHDFGVSSGSEPDGTTPNGVTIDRHGNQFGTTQHGGTNNLGIVWELTAAGVYKVLHDFGGTVTTSLGTSGPDGGFPQGGVTVDANGNLFGATFWGGYYSSQSGGKGDGMVWEITAAGKYLDLYDFGGTTVTYADGTTGHDGIGPVGTIAVDASGNLFGVTDAGGKKSSGVAWELASSGSYRVLHGFSSDSVTDSHGNSVPDGINPSAGVTLDSHGYLYGTCSLGGGDIDVTPYGGGTLWRISPSGSFVELHSFGSGSIANSDGSIGPDGVMPGSDVTVDAAGNLYGTTEQGGPYNTPDSIGGMGMVWELSSTGAYRDLHDFGGSATNANGTTGPDGSFPASNVLIDSTGTLYGVTNSGGPFYEDQFGGAGISWKLTASGVYSDLHDFGGSVTSASGAEGSDGMEPVGTIAFDPSGGLHGATLIGGYSFSGGSTGGSTGSTSTASSTGSTSTASSTGSSGGSGGFVFGGAQHPVPRPMEQGSYGEGMLWSLPSNAPTISGLSLTPQNVLGGSPSSAVISLSKVAPSGGATVLLTSSNSAAQVPNSITVPAGSDSATIQITTTGVNIQVSSTITASIGASSATGALTVEPAALTAVALDPDSFAGGASATGSVTLSGPAGQGGTSVSLISSSSLVSVPSSVIVPQGQHTGSFTVSSSPVSSTRKATITASLGSQTHSAAVTLNPAKLVSLVLSPTAVSGGSPSSGTVTLSGEAGASGMKVSLNSSSASAKVSASVTIAAGKSSATFTVSTSAVPSQVVAQIKATSDSTVQAASLTITPPILLSLAVSPSTVGGGGSGQGTLTISSPAGSGFFVKLSSNLKSASVPSSVAIASGKTTATFTIKTQPVASRSEATLTGTSNGASVTAKLTISPPELKAVTVKPASVKGGKTSTGTVSITSVAPSSGLVVALSSSLASVTLPGSVKIPSGKTSATFTIHTSAVQAATTTTIGASLLGQTQTATLTVTK